MSLSGKCMGLVVTTLSGKSQTQKCKHHTFSEKAGDSRRQGLEKVTEAELLDRAHGSQGWKRHQEKLHFYILGEKGNFHGDGVWSRMFQRMIAKLKVTLHKWRCCSY